MKIQLSIVIANYNYGRFLADAIASVVKQCEVPIWVDGRPALPIKGRPQDAVELIICDAASKDNSVEVIRRYEKYLSWWCSEPDGGQSAAFNKGFSHARGEWLTWLNADEMYTKGMLLAWANLVARKPQAEWITANDMHFDDATKKIIFLTWGPHRTIPFLTRNYCSCIAFGSSAFWRRSLYDKAGPIDEKLNFGMDTEYWKRLTMAGYKPVRFNYFCWLFREQDASKTFGKQTAAMLEQKAHEASYVRQKTGYTFEHSIWNLWYDLWMLWRLLDGSLFVRLYRRKTLVGQSIAPFIPE
jgi:glycosyltransferase involved in cell wall biosynthesis